MNKIINGLYKIVKFVGAIIALALISYLLSYIFEANTRTIFFRLIMIGSTLSILHSLGSK